MSYHAVIESIWCQENGSFFPPPWAWLCLTMAKVRLSLSICFWIVQECEMAFCACLGSTLQSAGTVQGVVLCSQWTRHSLEVPGCWVLLEPLLTSPLRLGSGLPPTKPFHEVADAFQHIFDLKWPSYICKWWVFCTSVLLLSWELPLLLL